MKYKNHPGLFDDHFLMEKLTKLGDPLQKLNTSFAKKILMSVGHRKTKFGLD
jgi:hypothetical protein